MTEGEKTRLVAWSAEMRRVHDQLREALRVTREAISDGGATDSATRELLLYCHGFCAALTAHHVGEDRHLFPEIAAQHPELAETLRYLVQDHSMIAHLVQSLRAVIDRGGTPAELDRHLEGIAAIMESHFRYEERQLMRVLDVLRLDKTPREVLGPL